MIVLVLTVMQVRYHYLPCYYPLWLCDAGPLLLTTLYYYVQCLLCYYTMLLLTMLTTCLLLSMPLLTMALCDATTHYATTYHGAV